ncbi:MAG: extracellular solute-binding protein [Turicibacter sp.]
MKKILSVVALTGISLSLVGCGGQEVADDKKEVQGQKNEVVTITVATNNVCGDDPYDDRVGTESCMSFEESEIKRAEFEKIEEEHGIKFKYVGYQTDDKVEEIVGWNLGGAPEADFVRLNADDYTRLVESGNLADITTYVEEASKKYDWFGNDLPYRLGMVGDKNYGIARDNMVYPEVLVYDLNILKDAGMEEMPNELWEKGEWNFETAREYFKKVQQYADSSSEVTYAFAAEAFYAFKAALGANGVKLIDGGNANANSEAVYDTMDYLETLRNDGVFNIYAAPYAAEDSKFKYALTDMKNVSGAAQSGWEKGTPDQEVADKDKGGVAFSLLDMWRLDCCIMNSDKDFGIVPFPENSANAFIPVGRGDMLAIPISVSEEKLEVITKAIALYDSLLIEPNEVEEWAKRVFYNQENAVEIMQYQQENSFVDPYLDYSGGYDWSYGAFMTEWFVDPTTLTTHLETLDGILESNLSK